MPRKQGQPVQDSGRGPVGPRGVSPPACRSANRAGTGAGTDLWGHNSPLSGSGQRARSPRHRILSRFGFRPRPAPPPGGPALNALPTIPDQMLSGVRDVLGDLPPSLKLRRTGGQEIQRIKDLEIARGAGPQCLIARLGESAHRVVLRLRKRVHPNSVHERASALGGCAGKDGETVQRFGLRNKSSSLRGVGMASGALLVTITIIITRFVTKTVRDEWPLVKATIIAWSAFPVAAAV